MIICGKVIGVNLDKRTAIILVNRPSTCAHGCENCSSCEKVDTQITVYNRQNCQIGDIVEAEVSDKPPIGPLAAVYLFPILMLFLIYILATTVDIIYVTAVIILIGALATYLLLRFINKVFKDRVQGEIINLIKSEKST